MDQNDLPVEVVLHRIGKCPVCGKGQMLKGTAGWTCDYFKSLQDKCTFTIFSSYSGYFLYEEDAVKLITDGMTEEKQFFTLSGKPFKARLVREGDKIKVVGSNKVLAVPCPVCGQKVSETQKGYACQGLFSADEEHCRLWIPKEMCGRTITEAEAEQLLENGRTDVLDGFTAQGKTFSSCLVVDKNGNVTLNGEICRCPKCGGTVHAGIKAYNCSNYRNPSVRCDFVVWRSLAGHNMTVQEVRDLCQQGRTAVLQFCTRDGVPYQRRLYMTDDGQIKMG